MIVNDDSDLLTCKFRDAYLVGDKVSKEYRLTDQLALSVKIGHVCGEVCKFRVAVKCQNLTVLVFDSNINVGVARTAKHISSILTACHEVGGGKCSLGRLGSAVRICGEIASHVIHRKFLNPVASLIVNTAKGRITHGVC